MTRFPSRPASNGTRGPDVRAREHFEASLDLVHRRCDRMFFWLMVAQWTFGIALAFSLSPHTWEGRTASIHVHVWLALFFGGALSVPLMLLTRYRPGTATTRQVAAVAQMLWSALLVHLTGGRIETHFHVFGSLAFLAFYRDWRVILTATVVVAAEHLVRGAYWPEAVYGIPNPEWWRFLEHASWVAFEDTVLLMGIQQSISEMRVLAERQASLEALHASLEERVVERTVELETSREQFRSLVESLHAVPWEMDVQTATITYVGPQGGKLLDNTTDEWRKPGFWAARVHEADLETVIEKFRACAAHSGRDEVEFRMLRLDGSVVSVRALFSRAMDRAGSVLRGLLLDVSERHRLEAELRQSQKLESVGRLAAGVAHEINTPTQFIGDNIRFLRDAFADLDDLIAATKEIVAAVDGEPRHLAVGKLGALQAKVDYDYIRAECPVAIAQSLDGIDRVAKIVYAMKDFAHADEAEKAVVDVNRTISSAVTVCRNEWKYLAELEEHLDEGNPTVRGYAQDLGQVVLNLVVNAAHAIGENADTPGAKGKISVRSRSVGDHVEIEIEDTGAGIPEEVRPRIFEQFFTTKPVGKGTGQGLALVHRIVTVRHGGQISFTSEAGKGTTFKITLPRG